MSDTPSLHDQAVTRLGKRRDFHGHLAAYVVVNGFLWAVWAVSGALGGTWFPWPIFPMLAWGIGLALNAWDVYWRREITEDDIRAEMARLSGTR